MTRHFASNAIIGSATDTMNVFLVIFLIIIGLLAVGILLDWVDDWRHARRHREEIDEVSVRTPSFHLRLSSLLRLRHWRRVKPTPGTFRQGIGRVEKPDDG